jgi:hypothetical protein
MLRPEGSNPSLSVVPPPVAATASAPVPRDRGCARAALGGLLARRPDRAAGAIARSASRGREIVEALLEQIPDDAAHADRAARRARALEGEPLKRLVHLVGDEHDEAPPFGDLAAVGRCRSVCHVASSTSLAHDCQLSHATSRACARSPRAAAPPRARDPSRAPARRPGSGAPLRAGCTPCPVR